MIGVIRKFFAFCPAEYRSKFYKALVMGVFMSFFRALSIPAVALVLSGVIEGNVTALHIWGGFGLMVVSVVGEEIGRAHV